MDREAFCTLVKRYCRDVGKSQKALASAVGIHYSVLSNKLNGTKNASFALYEIKNLVKILAQWQALTSQDEVIQLITLLDLTANCFTPQEWASPPLKDLDQTARIYSPARPLSSKTANPPPIAQAQPGLVAVAEEMAASTPVQPPLHNLPAQLTPLIGRNAEINNVIGFLQRADIRLLTLSGPGGVGKTRLALRTATGVVSDFEDGVWFIPLATISEPGLLVPTIAAHLGLKETGHEPLLQTLQTYLRPKQLLLILDNFEQLAESASTSVSQFLEDASRLKIMVTSRIRLQLYGEYIFDVPPLNLPAPPDYNELNQEQLLDLNHNEAVELFLQRTRAVRHDFRLNADNAANVVEICRWLDGLPLALELAAARLRVFTPAQLLEQLAATSPNPVRTGTPLNLTWLSGGGRNVPPRHQTIYHSLDWSYHLLAASQQHLFRRLGAFVGSFTAEAVLEICFSPRTSRLSLIESLQALNDHSLLRLVSLPNSTETRYEMLTVVREYALEKLNEADESDEIRQKHADYYFKLALSLQPSSTNLQAQSVFAPVERERANLRVVLDWLWEKQAVSQLVQLIEALWQFWYQGSYFEEASHWVNLVLKNAPDLSPITRAYLLRLAGTLYWARGDTDGTQACDEESLAIYQQSNNKFEVAHTLANMALSAKNQQKLERAVEMFEQAIVVYRTVPGEAVLTHLAQALSGLGLTLMEAEKFGQAEILLLESLAILEQLHQPYEVAGLLINLGNLALRNADYLKAKGLYLQSLALFQESDIRRGVAMAQRNLAFLALQEKDYATAHTLGRQSLTLRYEIGDKVGIASSLEVLAAVALAEHHHDQAVQIYAAANALRTTIKSLRSPFYQTFYETDLKELVDYLGEARFDALWEIGRQQPLSRNNLPILGLN